MGPGLQMSTRSRATSGPTKCKSGCASKMGLSLWKQDHLFPVGKKWPQRTLAPAALLEPNISLPR